jgi:selenocysteine lyase/cysteine desulfurase
VTATLPQTATLSGTAVGPAQFRRRFPILSDTVHLASCSLGPRSAALDDAFGRMLAELHADPTPWDQWLAEVEQARERFARVIGAANHQVAVVPSATVGAFQVASTLSWTAKPRIVTTDAEYSSVAQVWAAQQGRGAEIAYVAERRGAVPTEDVLAALDERAGLASIPLVSYRTGARLPVADVVAKARDVGARVFVDAYQSAGVLPIDVAELDCDYLVSGCMKYLLGIPGIAFLYVRDGVVDDQPPQLTGFYGRGNPIAFDPHALDWPDDARRFQVNMPTLPAAMAANAGLGMITELDADAVARHVLGLVDAAIGRLTDLDVPLFSPVEPDLRGPQVAVLDDDPMGLAKFLNARRIFPARGHVVRLSFHYFNDEADLDAACEAIAEWRAR